MTSEDLRNIGQFYLDVQQTKVACEHRMQKLLEHKLIEAGAAQLVHSSAKSSDDEPRSDFRKLKLEVLDESLAKKVTEHVKESKEFGILLQHKSRLVKQESDLLKSAEELFNDSSIWKFCERVRGLGPVAAMTFFTIINTDKIVDREHGEVVTAGKINKYLGLVPGQRLKSGEKMGFNTQMKGRAWMISRNVIMASDPYYRTIYTLQKELYTNRPDLIAQNGYTVRDKQGHYIAALELNTTKAKPKTKTKKNKKKAQEEKEKQTVFCHACNKEVAVVTVEDKKKRPGWKAWIDAMASRYVRKIILSHATEIIAVAEGLKFSRHQNYIPPKPEFPSEIDDVLEEFREQRAVQLKRYREQFAATGNTEVIRNNMQSYWENTSSNRQKSRA